MCPKVIEDFGIGTQQIRRQYKHSTLADSINRYVPHAIFFSDEALLPLAVQHSHRRGVSLTHFTGEIILRNRSNTTVLVPLCSGKVERSNRAKALPSTNLLEYINREMVICIRCNNTHLCRERFSGEIYLDDYRHIVHEIVASPRLAR